jgi:pimeloyl-ACP methyl ester carboxylesterase
MKVKLINAVTLYCLLISPLFVFQANARPLKEPPVFVLVHGAFHGGWCWQKVSKQLRAKGDVVYTPTLSGLGEHKNTLNSHVDLETHIADVVNLIVLEDLHNVILVGHSYAGAVIAGVADRIPERLSKLVFLDAMLMRNGESALDVSPDDIRENFIKSAHQFDNGLSLPFLSAEFFGVTNAKDIKWVNERLTNQPFRTFMQPLMLKHSFGNHLPLTYIACTHPELRAIRPFADETKASKEWNYLQLPTGHDAMITMPVELAQMLESLQ